MSEPRPPRPGSASRRPRRVAGRVDPRGRLRSLGVAVVAALLPVGLTACSAPDEQTPPAATSPTHTPEAGDPVVVGALPRPGRFDPTDTQDPGTARIADLLQRGLFRYDTKGKAIPEVATAVETTDHRVYQVTLAQGWRFSDGEAVTADSFVDAWNRLADPTRPRRQRDLLAPVHGFVPVDPAAAPTRAAAPPGLPAGRSPGLSGLTVTGPHTFTITLTHTHPGFEQRLGDVALAPLPDVAFTDPDGFAHRPVGNGPYLLEGTWSAGDTLTLKPNRAYTAGDPALNPGLEFRTYTDPAVALRDVREGRLDVLDVLPTEALPTYLDTFGTHAVDQPVGRATGIAFPVTREPWTGPAGSARRTAISMALDRETLGREVYGRTRDVATDLAPPVVEGHYQDLCGAACRLDADAAQDLLEGAGGLPGGLTIAYAADHDEGPAVTAICADLQTHLRIACTGRAYPSSEALRQAVATGTETGPRLTTWQMAFPLLENFLTPRFASGAMTNDTGYDDPTTDVALAHAVTLDGTERVARLQAAERRILTAMPVVPLFDVHVAAVSSPGVTDVRYDVFGDPAYTQITRPREK